LYVGISNYPADQAAKAIELLKASGTPCLIHQPKYSMFVRWVEDGLLDLLEKNGVGCIAFSPLAQGLLTNKYLNGIPADSRAGKEHGALQAASITPDILNQISQLQILATNRNQSLAQMAIAWLLKDQRVSSVLIGASSVTQLKDNIAALENLPFSAEELLHIEQILIQPKGY